MIILITGSPQINKHKLRKVIPKIKKKSFLLQFIAKLKTSKLSHMKHNQGQHFFLKRNDRTMYNHTKTAG